MTQIEARHHNWVRETFGADPNAYASTRADGSVARYATEEIGPAEELGVSGPPDGDTRPLTADERREATPIFAGSLDYDAIQVSISGIGSYGSSRTIGNTVCMTRDAFVPGTFELTPKGRDTLIHEMTHVWQYQHAGWGYAPAALWAQFAAWVMTGTSDGAYDWVTPAAAGTPWSEWNPEAQAEAAERYNQALKAAIAGTATPHDYQDLAMLQPYIDGIRSAPPPIPDGDPDGEGGGGAEGAGGEAGGGGDGEPPDTSPGVPVPGDGSTPEVGPELPDPPGGEMGETGAAEPETPDPTGDDVQ